MGRVQRREDLFRIRLDPEKEDEYKKKVVFIFRTWWQESIANEYTEWAPAPQAFLAVV